MKPTINRPVASRTVLTVEELAERWGCSRGSIYNLLKAGDLTHIRHGRLIRIPIQIIEKAEQAGILFPSEQVRK